MIKMRFIEKKERSIKIFNNNNKETKSKERKRKAKRT